ncbi:hypothetical protein AAHE18_09G112500 [Arachis hypogaea]
MNSRNVHWKLLLNLVRFLCLVRMRSYDTVVSLFTRIGFQESINLSSALIDSYKSILVLSLIHREG